MKERNIKENKIDNIENVKEMKSIIMKIMYIGVRVRLDEKPLGSLLIFEIPPSVKMQIVKASENIQKHSFIESMQNTTANQSTAATHPKKQTFDINNKSCGCGCGFCCCLCLT